MFASNIHEDEIERRIDIFRDEAQKSLSDNDIVNKICSIFGDAYSFPTVSGFYDVGTEFFRARPIGDDDHKFPLKSMQHVGDAWEKPADMVETQGRLNGIRKSVLYCCPNNPFLAIEESGASANKHVSVIVYRAKKPIKCAVLGCYEESQLPKDKMTRLFYSFLEEEFSQVVKEGEESRYAITRVIAETFFSYPNQDAWSYRSVKSRSMWNVAFLQGKQKECLELIGVMLCDIGTTSREALHVKMVVDFDQKSGKAKYHAVGSEQQKKLFPKISQN